MTGICGLCRLNRQLRDSHLLPAATYKLAREAERRNPNPVVVTAEHAGTTSNQVSDYFLCPDCEDRFSRLGERHVMGQCARRGGRFALRERLVATLPLYASDKFTVLQVDTLLGATVNHYLYFAASVFWRAAAKTWTLNGRHLGRLSLEVTRIKRSFVGICSKRLLFPIERGSSSMSGVTNTSSSRVFLRPAGGAPRVGGVTSSASRAFSSSCSLVGTQPNSRTLSRLMHAGDRSCGYVDGQTTRCSIVSLI